MKVSDWMPLVLKLCGREEKLTRYDPTYRAAHDLIDNERRRRKKQDNRATQQLAADIRDDSGVVDPIDCDALGAAE